MNLRSGRLEDLPGVRELLLETKVFTPAETACALELFRASVTGADPAYETLVVSGDDGAVAGYACFGPTPLTEGTYDLYWIAVLRRGLGGPLLEAVEGILKPRGLRLLLAETSSTAAYLSARRFYEKEGFSLAAVIRDFYRPGDHRLIYQKRYTAEGE